MTRFAPEEAFAILGVTPEDDFATIRRAWVRLIKEYHPDVLHAEDEAAMLRLAQINNAYDALRWHNPKKIRIHEQRAEQQRQGSAEQRVKPSVDGNGRRKSESRNGANRPNAPICISRTDHQIVNRQFDSYAHRKYLEVKTICEQSGQPAMARSV